MGILTTLTDTEMKGISRGTYYGNGVSCDDNGCFADWIKAATCIANMEIGGFLGGVIHGGR